MAREGTWKRAANSKRRKKKSQEKRLEETIPEERNFIRIMIVYGDPSYEIEFSVLVAQLQARMASVCAMTRNRQRGEGADENAPDVLDYLRSLLIFAGQVEQAVQDAAPEAFPAKTKPFWCEQCAAWTDAAAAAFAAALSLIESVPTEIVFASPRRLHFPDRDFNLNFQSPFAWATLLADGFQPQEEAPAIPLIVKLPEGFAFYALYPERYVESGRRWAAERAPNSDDPLLIMGVRSIGTSLSALVAADLQAQGRRVTRCTARPTGHPYARQVNVATEQTLITGTLRPKFFGSIASARTLGEASQTGTFFVPGTSKPPEPAALIIDEGPGMSGSSMASAAQALMEAGAERTRIAFLPGHGGEPGGQGDAAAQDWWTTTPRYAAVSLDAMRWNGFALPDVLAARTSDLYAGGMPVSRVETGGGGLWRRTAYASDQEWPAVCAAFERPKYFCTLENGSQVLWKFAGLATGANGKAQDEALFVSLTERSKAGWTTAPLGRAMGFVALPWIAGTLLTHTDADPNTLAHIARYLVAVSGPPIGEKEHEATIARLTDMLYWNTWEALGEAAAASTQQWSELAVISEWIKRARTYGDGHLRPHEWLRTSSGNLLKTDSGDHDGDHTIVGKQCYVWDVAGVIVEWQLDAASLRLFLDAVQQSARENISADALIFYRLAYAAFRIGQTAHCARISGHDPGEQNRLWRAYDRYKNALLTPLQTS